MIIIKIQTLQKTLILSLFFVFVFSIAVYAQEFVTTDPVRLRVAPSLDADSIRTLPVGTTVYETQRLAEGWSAVTVKDGESGFIFNQYLAPASSWLAVAAKEIGNSTIMYTDFKVNFRSDPSLEGDNIIDTLQPGTRVTVVAAHDDGWSKVKYNDRTGYMYSQYLATVAPERPMVTTDPLFFRTNSSTDADIIQKLPEGTTVIEKGRLENGWSFIEFNGQNGYVFNEYIITEDAYKSAARTGGSSANRSTSGSTAQETSRSTINQKIAEISPSGVELVDWGTMKGLFTIGRDALVTDVWTGLQYYVRSFSNGNHADVEPVSPNDTATMRATYGGSWTWDTRPVWVTINGRTFAASINGMPHGGGVNGNNNMSGQICIHFRGSRTHNGNRSHENQHQASITQAWNAANR